jgi:hypothetical protein
VAVVLDSVAILLHSQAAAPKATLALLPVGYLRGLSAAPLAPSLADHPEAVLRVRRLPVRALHFCLSGTTGADAQLGKCDLVCLLDRPLFELHCDIVLTGALPTKVENRLCLRSCARSPP